MHHRRGYVDTDTGQVHFRRVDGTGMPVVLLHFTPWSSAQFEWVLEAAAARRQAAVAFDFIGYGRSDPLPTNWSLADYANNIIAACDRLNITRACIVGGHFAAAVAVEMALCFPARVARLVLDGCPVWSADERARITAAAVPEAPAAAEDGGHVSWAWQRVLWLRRIWTPGLAVNAATANYWHAALVDAMATRFDLRPSQAFATHDLAARLSQVTCPTLLLTAEQEPLAQCLPLARQILPSAQCHRFAGLHPLLDIAGDRARRAADYWDVVSRFAAEL